MATCLFFYTILNIKKNIKNLILKLLHKQCLIDIDKNIYFSRVIILQDGTKMCSSNVQLGEKWYGQYGCNFNEIC